MTAPALYGQAPTTAVVDVTKSGSTVTLDLSRGGAFRWSGTDATGTVTLASSNVPAGSTSQPARTDWSLLLAAHTTAPTVTWTAVTWLGAAPTIANSEVLHVQFWTYNGGTTIYGRSSDSYSASDHTHA